MIKLTHEKLESLRTERHGFTKATTDALGVNWPLVKGWLRRLEGKSVSEKKWREAEKGKEKLTKSGEKARSKATRKRGEVDMSPDWSGQCEVCGQGPVVRQTGMCGPCTFGEADTIGGNW